MGRQRRCPACRRSSLRIMVNYDSPVDSGSLGCLAICYGWLDCWISGIIGMAIHCAKLLSAGV
jgi:hypothetical protein